MKYWQFIGHTFYFVPLLLDFPSLVVLAHGSSTKQKSAQPRRRQTTTVLTVWRLKKSSRSLSTKSYIQFVQRIIIDAPCNLHDQLLKNTTKIPFPRTFSSQWKRRMNISAWQTNYGLEVPRLIRSSHLKVVLARLCSRLQLVEQVSNKRALSPSKTTQRLTLTLTL